MVISHVAGRHFTRRVKESTMSATMTIMLNMKVEKSHAQRMTGHLLQDVSEKVSVLVFC